MIIPHVPTDRLGPDWPRSEGLTATQAVEAQQRYGPNDIVEAVEHPWWALARDTARDPMIWRRFMVYGSEEKARMTLPGMPPKRE